MGRKNKVSIFAFRDIGTASGRGGQPAANNAMSSSIHRMVNPASLGPQVSAAPRPKPNPVVAGLKSGGHLASPGGRSTSSLSSKEAEFQVMFNTGFQEKISCIWFI